MSGKNEAESADGTVADAESAQDMAAEGLRNAKTGSGKMGAAEKEEGGKAESAQNSAEEVETASAKKSGETPEELTNHLRRLAAEFDNYKKRAAKEKLESEGRGVAKMIENLLPFLDELEMADAAAEKSQDEALKSGMRMLCSKFRGILEKEGLSGMNPVGEKFDPYRHEAVMREGSGEEEGTIVKVLRKGYLLDGKILRHAMVSVSSGAKGNENGGKKDEGKLDS
jgi:molecular chaperone GrpE